jgi:hypothetical protein
MGDAKWKLSNNFHWNSYSAVTFFKVISRNYSKIANGQRGILMNFGNKLKTKKQNSTAECGEK